MTTVVEIMAEVMMVNIELQQVHARILNAANTGRNGKGAGGCLPNEGSQC